MHIILSILFLFFITDAHAFQSKPIPKLNAPTLREQLRRDMRLGPADALALHPAVVEVRD